MSTTTLLRRQARYDLNRVAATRNTSMQKVVYVDGVTTNGNGTLIGVNDSMHGRALDHPYLTIAYALTQVSADTEIRVAAGHLESISAATTWDIADAGISIIGLGEYGRWPIITFDTVTTALLTLDQTGVRLSRLTFRCNKASLAQMLSVTAAKCVLEDIELLMDYNSTVAVIGIGIDNVAADDVQIIRPIIRSLAAGAASAIKIATAVNNLHIFEPDILGNFSDSPIHNPTANVAVDVLIKGGTCVNYTSGKYAIGLISACTGAIVDVFADATLGILPGVCKVIGGSHAPGTSFYFSKTVAKTAIDTTALDLSLVSNGELWVEYLSMATDGTGVATATNVKVITNNANGTLTVLEATLANSGSIIGLGTANNTVDTPGEVNGVVLVRTNPVIEAGKKLQIQSTIADATGAGNVIVQAILRRMTGGAHMVAA